MARTGGAAFVLLDEEPGEVLAVPDEGDGELPGLTELLAGLDRVAVRSDGFVCGSALRHGSRVTPAAKQNGDRNKHKDQASIR